MANFMEKKTNWQASATTEMYRNYTLAAKDSINIRLAR